MIINNKKIFIWILILMVIILASVMLSFRSKGSSPVANRAPAPLYSWKSGALQARGPINPETCGLTTKKCSCNLSQLNDTCSFNLNFSGINPDAQIQVSLGEAAASSISLSNGCKAPISNQIQNCSVDFKWNKTQPGSQTAEIQLIGAAGIQSLIHLAVYAK